MPPASARCILVAPFRRVVFARCYGETKRKSEKSEREGFFVSFIIPGVGARLLRTHVQAAQEREKERGRETEEGMSVQ